MDKEKGRLLEYKTPLGGIYFQFCYFINIGNPITVGVLEGGNKDQLQSIKEIEWNNDVNALEEGI